MRFPGGEMLVGFAKTLYQEHPGYRGRILGLPKTSHQKKESD